MASRPPQVGGYVQELPPKGGFPIVRYRKVALQRGPSGLAIVLGGVALTAWGLYRSCNDNRERSYMGLARFNQRYERAFVLQAQEDIRYERKSKELIDEEAELFKDDPEWVPGQSVYLTQPPQRNLTHDLDPRTISSW